MYLCWLVRWAISHSGLPGDSSHQSDRPCFLPRPERRCSPKVARQKQKKIFSVCCCSSIKNLESVASDLSRPSPFGLHPSFWAPWFQNRSTSTWNDSRYKHIILKIQGGTIYKGAIIPLWRYLFGALYVYGEQSLAVALGSAGDATHLGGRGQTDGLQDERRYPGV